MAHFENGNGLGQGILIGEQFLHAQCEVVIQSGAY